MNLEKYTDRAKGFLQAAQTVAIRLNHQRITTEHILKALLEDEQGMAAGLIRAAGGNPDLAASEVDAALAKLPSVTGSGASQPPGLDNDAVRLLADVGYVYDTEFSQLSRFVWDFGAAVSLSGVTLDAGFGGSVYDEPIAWTPACASTRNPRTGATIALNVLEDNELGTTYVAARTGARVRLGGSASLSGTVTVPFAEDTFSPDAVGTLALDVAF